MGNWYAVRTATRREMDTAEALASKGFATYLPFQTRWRITPKLKETVDRPVFDGYLFVVVRSDDDFRHILGTWGVHQFVRSMSRTGVAVPMEIPAFAIEGVMSEEWDGRYNYTRPSRKERERAERRARALQPGAVVKIIEGPWAGFMAQVLRMTSSERSAVVDISGFAKSLTLDAEHLDAA